MVGWNIWAPRFHIVLSQYKKYATGWGSHPDGLAGRGACASVLWMKGISKWQWGGQSGERAGWSVGFPNVSLRSQGNEVWPGGRGGNSPHTTQHPGHPHWAPAPAAPLLGTGTPPLAQSSPSHLSLAPTHQGLRNRRAGACSLEPQGEKAIPGTPTMTYVDTGHRRDSQIRLKPKSPLVPLALTCLPTSSSSVVSSAAVQGIAHPVLPEWHSWPTLRCSGSYSSPFQSK